MPTDLPKVSESTIAAIGLDAGVTEDVVRAVLHGDRHVTPAQRGRVVAELSNRGYPIERLPRPAPPLLCTSSAVERIATGRLSRPDFGPNFHASRRDRG